MTQNDLYLLFDTDSIPIHTYLLGLGVHKFTFEKKWFVNPIPNRSGHVIYNERADSALTW